MLGFSEDFNKTMPKDKGLSQEEALRLCKRYHEDGDLSARNKIMTSYIPACEGIKNRASRLKNLSNSDQDELFSTLLESLAGIIDRYNYQETSSGFNNFCLVSLRGVALDFIRRHNRFNSRFENVTIFNEDEDLDFALDQIAPEEMLERDDMSPHKQERIKEDQANFNTLLPLLKRKLDPVIYFSLCNQNFRDEKHTAAETSMTLGMNNSTLRYHTREASKKIREHYNRHSAHFSRRHNLERNNEDDYQEHLYNLEDLIISVATHHYLKTDKWPQKHDIIATTILRKRPWSLFDDIIKASPEIKASSLEDLLSPLQQHTLGFGRRERIGITQAVNMNKNRIYISDIISAARDVYKKTGNVPLTNDTTPLSYKGLENTNWNNINIYLSEGRRLLPKTEGGLHALLKQHGMEKHWEKEYIFDQYDVMSSQLIYKYTQSENEKWANKRTQALVNDGTELDGRTWVSINSKSNRDIGMTLSQITKDYEQNTENYHMILRDRFPHDQVLMNIINRLDNSEYTPNELEL